MKKITLILFALFTCWQINAQVSSYAFSQSSGTYTPITGGTLHGTAVDDVAYNFPLPFTFNYGGTDFTTARPTSNGFLVLGSTAPSSTNYTAISTAAAASNNAISAFSRDLNATVRSEVIGDAPNRIYVCQWSSAYRYAVGIAENINFQIRLYETTNIIEFVYGDFTTTNTTLGTGPMQVGLRGTGNTVYSNRTTTTDWAATLAGTANNATMACTTVVKPTVGLTYVWTPPVPCTGAPVAGTVLPALQNVCSGVTPANLVASGFSSGVTGLTFQWEESDDDGATDAWTAVTGGTGATTATYTPAAFSGTPIYYRLNVTCTNSTTSAQTASVLVSTPNNPTNQISAVTIPAGTVNYSRAVVNWTNGNGTRRVVYISDTNTFTDPVNGNAPALTASAAYSGTGQQIIFDGTGSTVTVTGLATGTQYFIKAYEYARCGSGPYDYYYNVTTGTNIGSFTTCGIYAVPALENFSAFVPQCWQLADNGDLVAGPATFGTSSWAAEGFGNVGSTGAIRVNLDYIGDNDWILSPLYTVPANYELKFDASANQWGTTPIAPTSPWEADDFVEVLVSTGTTNWTVLYTYNNTNVPSNTGTSNIIDLDAYAGQTVRFAFRGVEGATDGSADIELMVDNFELRETPSCVEPTLLSATNITAVSADLDWTENGTATSWNIEYGITGFTPGTGTLISGISSSNYSLSGLNPNSTYQFYVQSSCGSIQSTWVGPIAFITPCNPYSVPYFEGFESGYVHDAAVASCLSQASVTGGGVWTVNSTNTTYNRTPRTGSYNATLVYGNEDWMFIPIQLVGGTSYRVSLHARQDGATAANSNMAISYGTANNAAGMTNSIVAATGIINGTYQEIFGDFTPATSGTYYVGIKGFMNGTPWYISLDDISITESPSCLNPTAIVASNITSNSVDLSWTDGSGGLQFDYEYVIQAPGTGEPTTNGAPIDDITVIGEGFDVNGNPLTANTLYEVYVRSVCGAGDFSSWSGPITFRTLCDAVGTINENFDGVTTPALPDCWSKILRGATLSSFATLTTTATNINSAPNSVALYNSSSATTTTDDIILVSPYLSNLNAGTHRLKFYARTNGSIQVGTLNSNTASAVFTPIQTIATTATSTLYVVDFSTYAGTDTFIGFRHNAGTYTTIYVDDVVWEPIPATAPVCPSNVVATPNPTCGNFANLITWDATPNSDGYYVTVGTTAGGTDIANATAITTNTYSFSGNFGTTYFYTIVPYNAIGSATGCTEQSFTTNANGCYCVSAPTSVDGTGITNVQLVATNFANTVSTAPVYNDHTATVVDMSQGINNNVQITFDVASWSGSYDYNTVIWIDANDNFTFESSEIVYTGVSATTAAPTLLNASFVIPAGISLGQHRMRIVATDVQQTPSNPCYSGSYGETADFTINVVAPSCEPPAATASVVYDCTNSQFSLDVNVTDLGNGSPVITDGTTTWPVSAIGIQNVGPFAFGTPVTLSILHGTDTICNLSLGIFNYGGCPPVNDDCSNATVLTPGGVFGDNDVVGTNEFSSASTGAPAPGCASYSGGDVWYQVAVPASGSITIETNSNSSSVTDTGMAVYSGTCNALVLVECDDDDSSDGNFSSISLTGRTPGEVLYFRVWEYSNDAFGTFLVSAYDASLSSGSFDNANFSAYPNPVKDVLNVSYTSEISSVKIINMLGQEVISKNINATSSQIDMSQLSAGTYIVNVTVGDTIKTLKVVKQ